MSPEYISLRPMWGKIADQINCSTDLEYVTDGGEMQSMLDPAQDGTKLIFAQSFFSHNCTFFQAYTQYDRLNADFTRWQNPLYGR